VSISANLVDESNEIVQLIKHQKMVDMANLFNVERLSTSRLCRRVMSAWLRYNAKLQATGSFSSQIAIKIDNHLKGTSFQAWADFASRNQKVARFQRLRERYRLRKSMALWVERHKSVAHTQQILRESSLAKVRRVFQSWKSFRETRRLENVKFSRYCVYTNIFLLVRTFRGWRRLLRDSRVQYHALEAEIRRGILHRCMRRWSAVAETRAEQLTATAQLVSHRTSVMQAKALFGCWSSLLSVSTHLAHRRLKRLGLAKWRDWARFHGRQRRKRETAEESFDPGKRIAKVIDRLHFLCNRRRLYNTASQRIRKMMESSDLNTSDLSRKRKCWCHWIDFYCDRRESLSISERVSMSRLLPIVEKVDDQQRQLLDDSPALRHPEVVEGGLSLANTHLPRLHIAISRPPAPPEHEIRVTDDGDDDDGLSVLNLVPVLGAQILRPLPSISNNDAYLPLHPLLSYIVRWKKDTSTRRHYAKISSIVQRSLSTHNLRSHFKILISKWVGTMTAKLSSLAPTTSEVPEPSPIIDLVYERFVL
jgi:hypothetical protein